MVQNPEALTTFSRLNYISCKYHINRVISPAETGQGHWIFQKVVKSKYLKRSIDVTVFRPDIYSLTK
jgi:hypothetical protein